MGQPASDDEVAAPSASCRRALCARCGRPSPLCCLCAALPPAPLELPGLVVVLQHPFEQRRSLATVPLLQLCLSERSLGVVRSRKPAPLLPLLRACAAFAVPLLFLYPSPESEELAVPPPRVPPAGHASPQHDVDLPSLEARAAAAPWVLLCVDGTWSQAREMAARLRCVRHDTAWSQLGHVRLSCTSVRPHFPSPASPALEECCPGARLVRLPSPAVAASALLVRSEPAAGCVSTAEAVALALSVLAGSVAGSNGRDDEVWGEEEEGGGVDARSRREKAAAGVAAALLTPLRLLVAQQARHDAAGKGLRPSRRAGRLGAAAGEEGGGGARGGPLPGRAPAAEAAGRAP